DGVWKHLDAVFAFIASGGGRDRNLALDSPEFAAACFGSRFNRLLPCVGEDAAPLVYFGEAPAPLWALAGVSASPWRPQRRRASSFGPVWTFRRCWTGSATTRTSSAAGSTPGRSCGSPSSARTASGGCSPTTSWPR